jgi:VWFA-related protein
MRTLVIYLLIAAMALPVGGQQPQAPLPTTGVKFSVDTSLVVVDVTVSDKSGAPVDGLKLEDFTLLEDGKPQKISVFEHQQLSLEPEPPPVVSLAEQAEVPPAPRTIITAEAPGKVQYRNKRLMVFFFDFSSMGMPEQLRAQEAAQEYLDNKITKDDVVAILLYASTLTVKTDFTSDRNLLSDIIKSLPIGEMAEMADLADTGDDDAEDTGSAFVADETEFNIFNTDQKLAAIEKAARMLAALPEKKALLYFAGGVSKTGVDNQAQLEASINAAVKANVSIYPIDTRGLMAAPPGGGASKAASRGAGNFNGSSYNSQRAGINNSQETLMTLASETGGKAFVDSNDLTVGIEHAQRELRSYYILGYYTTNAAEDGRYRRISVKLNNNQTAKLEHRQGYYANKVWGKFSGQDKEQQLREALASGQPITDLPLALQVDYFRVAQGAYFVPVSVKVPGSVVAMAVKGGASLTQLDFIGQIQDEARNTVGNVRDFIRIKLDAELAKKVTHRSFQYDAGFTLGPGKYRMKFLVRENVSGKMGTFETRFTVPDLSADTSGLKLSSIIWSSQREALKAAVGSVGAMGKKELSANPLMDGGEKVVPNITKIFRRSQNLYVMFDVYDARPDPANANARKVQVSMSLFNAKGVKAFEVGPIEATQVVSTRPEAVPVKLQAPLKDLAAGRYTCQINVIDPVGRKFAFPRTPLVVAP